MKSCILLQTQTIGLSYFLCSLSLVLIACLSVSLSHRFHERVYKHWQNAHVPTFSLCWGNHACISKIRCSQAATKKCDLLSKSLILCVTSSNNLYANERDSCGLCKTFLNYMLTGGLSEIHMLNSTNYWLHLTALVHLQDCKYQTVLLFSRPIKFLPWRLFHWNYGLQITSCTILTTGYFLLFSRRIAKQMRERTPDNKQNVPILHIGCAADNVTTEWKRILHNGLLKKSSRP